MGVRDNVKMTKFIHSKEENQYLPYELILTVQASHSIWGHSSIYGPLRLVAVKTLSEWDWEKHQVCLRAITAGIIRITLLRKKIMG